MNKFVSEKMYRLSNIIEFLISIPVVITIIILTVRLGISAGGLAFRSTDSSVVNDILGDAMTMAVGVEFIKMLCKHTPDTIIETLMFAIARGMVVEHASSIETLLGVLCIAVLFAIEKFLFNNSSDTEKITLRGSHNVRMANFIAKIKIPEDGRMLLRDVLVHKLEEENQKIATGASAQFDNFELCVAGMRDGKIHLIEVIKTN